MNVRYIDYIKYFSIVGIYILAFKIIFMRPLDIQYWQWADDALYFYNAKSVALNLGKEYWLGPFNKIVISKAPFFSVFLAGIHFLSIPLRLGEFLIFAPLPFYLLIALRPLKISIWTVLIPATLCLILIPSAGTEYRLLRNTLFGALVIYFLISLCATTIRFTVRVSGTWFWAILTGLAMGFAVTTREEASWLMLPAFVAILYIGLVAWQTQRLSKLLIFSFLAIFSYFIPILIFSTLNYTSYGVFSPSLRQNADFRELFSILTSLNPKGRQRFVPINAKTRELAYKVSPTFAELKEFLEGPSLDSIAMNEAHFLLNEWMNNKNREFFVSNFEFALTEAILLSGRNTGKSFIQFCQYATNEIREAIENGEITAGKKGFSMLPPIRLIDVHDILLASIRSFWLLMRGEGQNRHNFSQSMPLTSVADEWHAYLKTWSYPHSNNEKISSIKLKNRIFKMIVLGFRSTYFLVLILGLTAGTRAYMNKCVNSTAVILNLVIGWTAVISFSLAMGVVHVIGFPVLKYPGSYNSIGFFPLHFLLTISVISFFLSWEKISIPATRANIN